MPTVMRIAPFAFVFFSSDRLEPSHIHVKRDDAIVKFWLEPVLYSKSRGFADHELETIRKLVEEHRETFLRAWHDYFGA